MKQAALTEKSLRLRLRDAFAEHYKIQEIRPRDEEANRLATLMVVTWSLWNEALFSQSMKARL